MPVTREDVKHMASLSRLALTDDRADQLTAQLNTILGHMDALSRVNTSKLEPVEGIGEGGAPLRTDEGPPVQLAVPLSEIAPLTRDGFILVPRLSTHETAQEG